MQRQKGEPLLHQPDCAPWPGRPPSCVMRNTYHVSHTADRALPQQCRLSSAQEPLAAEQGRAEETLPLLPTIYDSMLLAPLGRRRTALSWTFTPALSALHSCLDHISSLRAVPRCPAQPAPSRPPLCPDRRQVYPFSRRYKETNGDSKVCHLLPTREMRPAWSFSALGEWQFMDSILKSCSSCIL